MIVKMKEVLLFTTSRSVERTIQHLGDMGIVDIQHLQEPHSDLLSLQKSAAQRTRESIDLLQPLSKNQPKDQKLIPDQGKAIEPLVNRVLMAAHIQEKIEHRLGELNTFQSWYKVWGQKVNAKDLQDLSERGIYIRLYELDKADVQKHKVGHTLFSFPAKNKLRPTALVSLDPNEKLPFKETTPPSITYSEVMDQIQRKKRQRKKVEDFLVEQAGRLSAFKALLSRQNDLIKAQKVMNGMPSIDGKISYLRGFLPKEKIKTFKTQAKKNNWGYHLQDPANPDEVPVLIKNPKWINIINPVMKFIDILPGYKEVDVSIYFLIAFALFFAMLVGDAGYGLLFLILAVVLRKKMSAQLSALLYVLSSSTIIWGVLSGTYFGSESIAGIPYLQSLIIPNIASFGVDNVPFMMHLSFLIGAIHLNVAHGIRAISFSNSIRILSEVGWMALVWALFFITEQLVLGITMPGWSLGLLIVGALLVALFSKEGNSLKSSVLISLGNLPLNLISGFSDIVSYVRLFAVGLATAAVASSFNQMILPEGISNLGFLQLFMAGLALALGHGLNIALALMAVMVHGIRLNMLEFSGHLGVQFSGEAYKPFKLQKQGQKKQNQEERSL